MIHLLFLCHGNICRSPMAEFIMKDLVRRAHLEEAIAVSSAAVTEEDVGRDMYPAARQKLREKGVPFAPRAARLVTPAEYEAADFVFVMDGENLRRLPRLVGAGNARNARLLMESAGEARDVADPWYTGDFETAYRDIARACGELLSACRERLARL